MAQHDFVPAWLNFSTPQSTKVIVASINVFLLFQRRNSLCLQTWE